ncbi:MAG: glycosyltransferase [Saprospiraceae bacterium]|nr:glycosyltransferase [Saprospiraceae bacterium]
MSKSFLVVVTNDLNQDQRMHRICNSIAREGHQVLLLGREKKDSQLLLKYVFNQKRLKCWFSKGILFYLEYNIRVLLFALQYKVEVIYSVDLDTLLACGSAARMTKSKLIHDAHEYFVEVPELTGKSLKKAVWNRLGNYFIPKCDLSISVNQELSDILSKKYKSPFQVIRNVPSLKTYIETNQRSGINSKKVILYQGVLNAGRGLEEVISAMPLLGEDYVLRIAGEGDISNQLRGLADSLNVMDKVQFLGWLNPEDLRKETLNATMGLNLLSGDSLNYHYSLANKFFDYMHAEVPSINMNFPVYARICATYPVGLCIDLLTKEAIKNAIELLGENQIEIDQMKSACIEAKKQYNWESESQKLIQYLNEFILD